MSLQLGVLQAFLRNEEVTEICINRPGTVFTECVGGWKSEAMPELDLKWCLRFAKLVANYSRQRIDATTPLLSASLPGGERVQIVLPPATSAGCVAIAIRRPGSRAWSLSELGAKGIFQRARRAERGVTRAETELLRLLAAGEFESFLRLAVHHRLNIVVSGPTGSGKTTCTKALIGEIPRDERLITIEDARELVLDGHRNHVRLFYSKDDQGVARVGPRQLIECCLRMKPDRILLAELRGDEAFDYLRSVNCGHPGSITSIHASSAELAFEQLMLLIKQSEAGRELSRTDIRQLLYQSIDVIIQFDAHQRQRYIREVWYEPSRKRLSSE
ncbi:MAG TPA: P-type DNA transfer ATPase VirB11 [Steroidobacteraceae bacterium]|nr:P-type DNA transfer ATPase VirB11 [Steroidobacteraceae bacterium]